MGIAGELAARIKAFRYDDLPDEAVLWAKTAILDTVGVTLAGSREECVRILESLHGIGEGDGPCLVFGRAARTGPLDAALINGTASHALDFDDVAPSIGGHPSVPLVPAVIALGEMTGAGGKDAITAYVAGFETESRIARAVNFHHYEKGWHPTTTLGIFGTVAASALLLDLSEDETETALALAVSLASGVKANFGTMTKPLHVGHCVRNGMLAAMLAQQGFTSGGEAFEHKQGFLNVFNGPGNFDAEKIFENWADPLDIVEKGLGLKQFPCCGSTHPAINCMLKLVNDDGLKPEDAAGIEILTNPRRLPHTDHPDPKTGLEGKFSIQYVTARALTDGRVVFAHFEDSAVAEKETAKLLPIISVGEHPDMAADSDNQFAAEVTVTTREGAKLSARMDHELGRGPDNPMSRDELWTKFEDCAALAMPKPQIRPLFEMLENLDDVTSMAALTDAVEIGEAGKKERHVG
jgi:2-methylcitrate dehydratase PrpD